MKNAENSTSQSSDKRAVVSRISYLGGEDGLSKERLGIGIIHNEMPIQETASCDLSIVIPAKNEGPRLPATLDLLFQSLKTTSVSYELIVVNDGSSDDTISVAESRGGNVINNGHKNGIAAAFRAGAKASVGDVVMLCPADIEDFSFLQEALFASKTFDVVSVSKRHPRSIVIGYGKWRWFLSNSYQKLVTILFGGVGICTDTHYIKLYDGKILRTSILDKCKISGPVGETEMMLLARNAGCSFYEVPARIVHKGNGSKTSPRLIFRAMFELLSLWLGENESQYQ